MLRGFINHLDLTSTDLAKSTRFYDQLLGHLGFVRSTEYAGEVPNMPPDWTFDRAPDRDAGHRERPVSARSPIRWDPTASMTMIYALFRKELSEEQLSALFGLLCRRGIVRVDGTKVSYELASGP